MNVLSKINHPNVIKCYDIFTVEGKCYIVTELCDGGDVDELIKKEGVFNEERVVPILKDILNGMCYLHEMRIIHRDLKTANVFLKDGVAKIADFGFAVFAE